MFSTLIIFHSFYNFFTPINFIEVLDRTNVEYKYFYADCPCPVNINMVIIVIIKLCLQKKHPIIFNILCYNPNTQWRVLHVPPIICGCGFFNIPKLRR